MQQPILIHCIVYVSDVTQVATVSVSVQPLLPMLKSVTAEGFTSAGGPRSSVVCQRHTTPSHTAHVSLLLSFVKLVFFFFCPSPAVFL